MRLCRQGSKGTNAAARGCSFTGVALFGDCKKEGLRTLGGQADAELTGRRGRSVRRTLPRPPALLARRTSVAVCDRLASLTMALDATGSAAAIAALAAAAGWESVSIYLLSGDPVPLYADMCAGRPAPCRAGSASTAARRRAVPLWRPHICHPLHLHLLATPPSAAGGCLSCAILMIHVFPHRLSTRCAKLLTALAPTRLAAAPLRPLFLQVPAHPSASGRLAAHVHARDEPSGPCSTFPR